MEYRGIRYEVKMAAGADQWVWTVHTPNPKQGRATGQKARAILAAERAIRAYCYTHPVECGEAGA